MTPIDGTDDPDRANTDLQHRLADALVERDAALAREAALAEVLAVINRSPGDPGPVFDAILEKAHSLCGAAYGSLQIFDGESLRATASRGFSDDFAETLRQPHAPMSYHKRLIEGARLVHVADLRTDHVEREPEIVRGIMERSELRSLLVVPLRKEGVFLGFISAFRPEVRLFSDAEIALLESFAAQAVIAMENARLLGELRERTEALAERKVAFAERIDHQAATIDVLKAMSASPGDAQPVFELICRQGRALLDAPLVALFEYDGGLVHFRANDGAGEMFAPGDYARYAAGFPMVPDRGSLTCRAILDGTMVHVRDMDNDPDLSPAVRGLGHKTTVSVPLLRDGRAIGAITTGSMQVDGVSDTQIELLKTFAEQAAIAIGSAETYRALRDRTAALARRNTEFGERIGQQSATIDVLKAMSASPDDPQPAFDLIARHAAELCESRVGLTEYKDGLLQLRATHGFDPDAAQVWAGTFPRVPALDQLTGRAVLERRIIHIREGADSPVSPERLRSLGGNTGLMIPILRDGEPIGTIGLNADTENGFTDSQIALLQTFAEQAAIAIGGAETYRALQERTAALALRNSEFGERIEQQSATIDVLKVMSNSPDDTQPVFDQIVKRAKELCNCDTAVLFQYHDGLVHFNALHSDLPLETPAFAAYRALFPMLPTRESVVCRSILDSEVIHIDDIRAVTGLSEAVRTMIKDGNYRSQIVIPLMRDGRAIGCITLTSKEPGGYTDSQIALLQTFAEQAVIAIGSVATFRALRERTAELTRSVSELQALEEVLRAVNSSLDLETVLETIIGRAVTLSQADEGMIYEYDDAAEVFVPKSAFGMTEDRIAGLRQRRIRLGETYLGRSALERKPVHVEDVQQDTTLGDTAGLLDGIHAVLAVPLLKENKVVGGLVIRRRTLGGFDPSIITLMQTFAGQSVLAIENARLFQELAERGEEARQARLAAEATLADLRKTQDRLVQTEKLASLGQLTAGIAHEIKNPLNFVNNFSELSVDLLDEFNDAVAPSSLDVAPALREQIDDIVATLKLNLEKIIHHGKRADSIVKNMLLHSRTGPSEHRPIDVNTTIEEALNLAFHGARAENKNFNITMTKDLDPATGSIEAYPQEFLRVMLNLIGNGFYAAHKRAIQTPGHDPVLKVSTEDSGESVTIRVRDNGTGIPADSLEKIFEPFFTTKPAGEGTGLGLSLSHDIIVKQHGGQVTVASQVDTFTEFTVTLPRRMAEGAAS